jgi:hypothetical protein
MSGSAPRCSSVCGFGESEMPGGRSTTLTDHCNHTTGDDNRLPDFIAAISELRHFGHSYARHLPHLNPKASASSASSVSTGWTTY